MLITVNTADPFLTIKKRGKKTRFITADSTVVSFIA